MSQRHIIFWSLLFVFTLCSLSSVAQTPITKSDSINWVKGEKFFVHTVASGHTIYGISVAYGIEVHEIYQYNPSSKELLSLGQTLLIPAKSKSVAEADVSPAKVQDGFIYHTVMSGETLYRIAVKYGLKDSIIKEYNQGLTTDIYPGQMIKIPELEKVVSDKSAELYDSVFVYLVLEKETYFSLKKKFRVTQKELELLNPILKSSGLQKGMKIKVPATGRKNPFIRSSDFIPNVFHTKNGDTSAIVPFSCDSFGFVKPVYKVAFMMPFYSQYEGDINVSNVYRIKDEKTYKSFQFIHFYEGFLLAADSMAKLGMKIELFVYDTKKDTSVVRRIVNKAEFKDLDLIIGPLFSENLHIVAKAIRGSETRMVNPFSLNTSLLADNQNMFFMQPLIASKVDQMLNYVKDSLPNANVIVLHNKKRNEVFMSQMLKTKYARMASQTALDTNRFFVYSYKDGGYNKLVSKLDKSRPNILFNLTDNEASMSNFVRNLYRKVDHTQIILMGDENHWNKFKTLEHKYLFALNLTLTSASFIDFKQASTAAFTLSFRDRYKTEPKTMAYQGYDAGWYFLNALYRYGTHFENCMHHQDLDMLTNQFRFVSGGKNAWQNASANIYSYKNYQLTDKRKVIVPIPAEWLIEESSVEMIEGEGGDSIDETQETDAGE